MRIYGRHLFDHPYTAAVPAGESSNDQISWTGLAGYPIIQSSKRGKILASLLHYRAGAGGETPMSESAGSAAEAPQPEAAADTNNHETHQRQRQEEAHRAGAAAAAAAATVTMMDVEIPALPPADGDGGLPPLGADDETEAAAAAAATAAATAAAAAAPVPVPVQAVRYVPIMSWCHIMYVCHAVPALFGLPGAVRFFFVGVRCN